MSRREWQGKEKGGGRGKGKEKYVLSRYREPTLMPHLLVSLTDLTQIEADCLGVIDTPFSPSSVCTTKYPKLAIFKEV